MDVKDDDSKFRSRKRRKNERDKRIKEKYHRDRRFEESEDKDDVSCCGRPRQRNRFYRRRHHRHHRSHKSKRHQKSQKEMTGTKEEIPSPIRPPTIATPQASASNVVAKAKQKDDKESGEMASTNQVKMSASGEVTAQGKSSCQTLGTENSTPTMPSRDNQKVEVRESPYQQAIMNKNELLQELCITQCIRDGYEISRLAYTTCFPIGKKPNFIYLPKFRFTGDNDVNSVQKKPIQKIATDLPQESTPTGKNGMLEAKINVFMQNLNECYLTFLKASRNISNLKLLAAGETLNEVHRYDTDIKAIINDLKFLQQFIAKKFTNLTDLLH